MENQEKVRLFLKDEFDIRKNKNSRYSLRRYAEHLNLDPSLLSKFLTGKRSLGLKNLAVISAKLDFPTDLKNMIYAKSNVRATSQQVENQSGELFQNWWDYAIFEYMLWRKQRPNIKILAPQLGITVEACENSVERLIRGGPVEDIGNGELKIDATYVLDYHQTATMRRVQQGFALKSIEAMDRWDKTERTTSSLTFAINSAQLPIYEIEIKKFLRRMNRISMRAKKKNKIYNFQVSLFPLVTREPS